MRLYLRDAIRTSLVVLVVCPLAVIISNNEDGSDDDSGVDVVEYNGIGECGPYFAKSTIPGAGYGMFAGRDYRRKEFVTPGDISVPAVEFECKW
jgi:hypothetical protein